MFVAPTLGVEVPTAVSGGGINRSPELHIAERSTQSVVPEETISSFVPVGEPTAAMLQEVSQPALAEARARGEELTVVQTSGGPAVASVQTFRTGFTSEGAPITEEIAVPLPQSSAFFFDVGDPTENTADKLERLQAARDRGEA